MNRDLLFTLYGCALLLALAGSSAAGAQDADMPDPVDPGPTEGDMPPAPELPDAPAWDQSYWYASDPADEVSTPEETTVEEAVPSKALPSGFSAKSGVSPQALALPDGNGSIQGMGESFTPDLNTGSGTFSVPIALPPGRRGVQPQLGLGYTTGAGNGVLGWGWNLGVPFITRQSDKGLPRYNRSDRFIYNGGTELVPIAMPTDEEWPPGWRNGANGDITYFRARLEGTFMRFFYNRTADAWLVQDKQGNHYYFGEYDTEKVIGPEGTYQWNLTRMADIRRAMGQGGNDIHYTYIEDGNNLYFSDIYWNSHGTNYGDLETYQHRVHFRYERRPDVSTSFAAGFPMAQNLRLVAIEVSSFLDAPSGSRTPTRTYVFTYLDETQSFHSKLASIQLCGRDYAGSAGSGTCMPPMAFYYSQTQDLSGAGSDIGGFGAVNALVQSLDVSPNVSLDDPDVEFLDVNQDGLPDLFITRPEDIYFGADHAVIFNDPQGNGALDPDLIEPVDNPAGWSLRMSNLNVQVMDIDGTGNADLLHMPYAQKYSYYRLTDQCASSEFCWDEVADIPLNPDIDFTNDADDIQLVDLNNDHLIDIVRTAGTRMEHFFNLSATRKQAGGAFMTGQFGHFDDNGYGIANQSVNSCILMRGGPMQFHNGNLRFGDMNGDGLQDLVDLKTGSIAYWPNRGYGRWGNTTDDCAAGKYVDGTEVEMTGSPYFSNPDYEGISIADLNGDGLSDLVQIRYSAVDIWLNRGDNSFTPRHIIRDTPYTPSGTYGQVRFADINGSGTVDIVWGNAGNYQYIDLGGDFRLEKAPGQDVDNQGLTAGMLETVENGLGGATYFQYATTTGLMMAAEAAGEPWTTTAPMPLTVVTKTVSRDFLEELGGPEGRYVQEFVYRNPWYDAHEAEFKGFSYAESWDRERDGDNDGAWDQSALCSSDAIKKGEAPLVSRNWFHSGIRPECMERPEMNDTWPGTWGPHSAACARKLHEENPLLGLTGASIRSEVFSPCTGRVVEATVSEIEVRRLFASADAHDRRNVYFVTPNQGRVYKYDLDGPPGGGAYDAYQSVVLTNVAATDVAYPDINGDYVPAAPVGYFHLITGNTDIDRHGNPTRAYYGGFTRLSDSDVYFYANCDQYTEHTRTSFNPSTWVHTADESWVTGAGCDSTWPADTKFNHVVKAYDEVTGDMQHSMFYYGDVGAGAESESLVANVKVYNAFGQVVENGYGCAGDLIDSCARRTANVYQGQEGGGTADGYSAYIVKEITYLDGAPRFVTQASWDGGFGHITQMIDMNGARSAMEYDALGRFVASFGPGRDGQLCSEAQKRVEYHYGFNEAGIPMSWLVTHINTSQTRCGDNPWDDAPADMETGETAHSNRWEMLKTFVDAMGRTYATVVSGDNYLGSESAYPYVVNGEGYLNAKGKAWKTCEGAPLAAMPQGPADVVGQLGHLNCAMQEFDAYGRPTVATAPDNTQVAVSYGLDSAHSWDHLDLHGDACHQGTYSTQRIDGLGRAVLSVSRYRTGAVCNEFSPMVEKWSVPRFDALGNVVVATQFEVPAGGNPQESAVNTISRWASYDTLGRLRFNRDVTFGLWEYQYDELGQLVYAQSPMGDEFLYEYDGVGRLVSEQSRDHNSTAFEVEARYFFDTFPSGEEDLEPLLASGQFAWPAGAVTLGRLVATRDRSGISVVAQDLIGLWTESWRMVLPDETKVYHSESLSDWAGQLVYAEDDGQVRTTASYYENGTPQGSFVSYLTATGRQYRPIVLETRSNIAGQTELVRYGDGAQTVQWTGYNGFNHRVLATVVQQQDAGGVAAATLMAFGYEYNNLGMLTGIADWRGRGSSATSTLTNAPHPAAVHHSFPGYHAASMPSTMDPTMTAPATFNGSYLPETQSGWPVSASPSDASFDYDGRYQLVGEERDYVTGAEGDDLGPDGEKRLRSVRWDFDPRGNMVSWAEEADAGGAAVANLGRALGGTIENGWQLNEGTMCGVDPAATGCFIPDAIYFATNVGDAGIPSGRGTCVWAAYDASGRMVQQTVRTGCMSCTREDGPVGADCPDPTAERTDYLYAWNAYSQLMGAHKYVNIDTPQPDAGDLPDVVMTYLYDAGGNRVVREQSNIAAGEEEIYQDVYLGSLERRHVQLLDSMGIARSIHSAQEGLHFVNVGDTRQVHYAAGARLQWKVPETGGVLGATPQIFLSFSNHLGSTSAVIDYETGALVEWNTYYAYGADESRWKNTDAQYDNAEEPYGFTGKEEDDAVGLHYFGARYYSSHLGRWLTPDPPVIHGGGLGNYYNYGGNSPYIYVDPDGNAIEAVIAAIVGGVIGAVTGAIQAARAGKGPGQILLHALWGSVKGSHIALASAYGGPWAGAGAAACFATLESLVQTGGNLKQAFIAGNVAFGTSLASSGFSSLTGPIGDEAASAAITAVGQAMAKSAVQFTTSMLMSSGFAAVTGGLNSENWDDILIDNAISATISTVGNVTVTVTKGDSGSRGGGEATKGGGTDNGESPYLSADSDAAPKPAPGVADYDEEFRKQVEIINNLKNSDQSGRKVAIIFENFKSGSEDQKEFNNKILPALVIMYQDKGYDDILLFRGATKAEYERIMSIGFKQRAISVWGHGEQPYSIHNPGGRLKLSNGDWMSMDVFNITPPGTRNDSIFFGVCWAGQQVHHISWANSANAWASPNKQRMNVFLWDFIDFMDHQR